MMELKDKDFFKDSYSEEEVNDVLAWFDDKMNQLPKTLKINKSTSSLDLPKTVSSLVQLIRAQQENGGLSVIFSGYIAHLMLIRHRLKELNPEWKE